MPVSVVPPEVRNQLSVLASRLSEFRRKRTYCRAPIPTDLWQAAIALAQETSPIIVSKALKLDVGNLRQRMRRPPLGRVAVPQSGAEVAAPQFVRIAPVVFADPVRDGAVSRFAVEIQNQHGAVLRISELSEGALNGVVSRFLAGGAGL